jgi:O-antigen/teichoic acid export membrane protein
MNSLKLLRNKHSISLGKKCNSVTHAYLSLSERKAFSDLIRQIGETFATRMMLMGISIITSVIVARALGPEGRGFYAVAAVIGAIGVQFGNLGLHASNTYYVARDRKLLSMLIGNTILVSFALGGCATFLVWLIFTLWPKVAPVGGLLLLLSLIWIPFSLAYLLLQNLLLGIQEVHAYNRIELISKILGVGLIGVLILLRAVTAEKVLLTGLIALIISFFWALSRLQSHLSAPPRPSMLLLKENISYGFKAYLAAFLAFLVLKVDLLMVKYILGPEQTGYYSIAVAMADMVYMLPTVIATILFPRLSTIPNKQEKWMLAKKVVLCVGLVMLVLVCCSVFLAEPIVQILFGKAFMPAVPAFMWLMPGIFFLGIEIVAVQFLNSIGFPIIVVYIWGFSTALNVGVDLYAIRAYGIIGASVVSSVTYFVVFVFVMIIIRRTLYAS